MDAVVNAANDSLLPGGGVSGAMDRAAGPLLFYARRDLGGWELGAAKITDGYELPATYVIHIGVRQRLLHF
jgi:O-acetyl-ADP-ribose deacetylase